METPPIEYVHTQDGVSIAVGSLGQGSPVDIMPESLVFSAFDSRTPGFVADSQLRREGYQLISYDYIGSGLSDRRTFDYSTDGLLAQLEAVVNGLELPPFRLYGNLSSAAAAALEYPWQASLDGR